MLADMGRETVYGGTEDFECLHAESCHPKYIQYHDYMVLITEMPTITHFA